MNNTRRKQLSSIQSFLDTIKREIDRKAVEEETGEAGDRQVLADLEENWSSRVDDLRLDLDSIKDDEQEYYDNMPEGLQAGDKGTLAEDAITSMQSVLDDMEELLAVEDVGAFTRLFNEKYDDMDSNLDDAAA